MILTLDNADGYGAVDYTATLATGAGSAGTTGLTITRTLNQPSTLEATLCLAGTTLAVPARKARVVIAADSGALLFTGYLTTEPVPLYAGVASAGPVYRLALRAASDEWLLDRLTGFGKAGARTGGALALGSTGAAALSALTSRLGASAFTTAGTTGEHALGIFSPAADASWSAAAGAAAAGTYGAYRVLDGTLSLTTAGSVTHTLADGDGVLSLAALRTTELRELANDVTVSGAMEPDVYWTELFTGDGTTVTFPLAGEPDAVNAGHARLIDDGFAQPTLDTTTWTLTDPGSHLALSSAGLAMNGGNGLDGQTTLAALNPVEMGGTLIFELDSVLLNPASAGVVGGLYQGSIAQSNCLLGFHVRQAGGNTVVTPMVNGAEIGTTFTILEGHAYTLRLDAHCPELLRIRQAYYALSESSTGGFQVARFGGGLVTAPMSFVFSVRDLGLSSNTPVTVLYDGSLASSPASCTAVAVNSVQLFGSIGAVRLTRTGTAWVTTTDPTTGQVATQLTGTAPEGVSCRVTGSDPITAGPVGTGSVTFFAGQVPVANAAITVRYRGRQRAVARMADVASVAAEVADGAPGTSRWIGKVLEPPARSTEDCEAAAAAVLSFAADRSAATAGSCSLANPTTGDLWPGDALSVTANGGTFSAILRRVAVEIGGAAPEVLRYTVGFANDWAEGLDPGLGLTLSEAIAPDAVLPATAIDSTVPVTARVLANLQSLTVVGTVGSGASRAFQIDAGQDAPAGGGFEVRRRDGCFGSGILASGGAGFTASDLVLRSPVRGFQIPLAAAGEQFFIRMYDASTPPLYSRASAAVVS